MPFKLRKVQNRVCALCGKAIPFDEAKPMACHFYCPECAERMKKPDLREIAEKRLKETKKD